MFHICFFIVSSGDNVGWILSYISLLNFRLTKVSSLPCPALPFFIFLLFFFFGREAQIMLNSKDENHKNVRKSWQSLLKSQLCGAKKIFAPSIYSQLSKSLQIVVHLKHVDLVTGRKQSKIPASCMKHMTLTLEIISLHCLKNYLYSLLLQRNKMLINWTISWPAMQTIWVIHLNQHLRLAVLAGFLVSTQQEMKLKWNWSKTNIDHSALHHHLSWNVTVI